MIFVSKLIIKTCKNMYQNLYKQHKSTYKKNGRFYKISKKSSKDSKKTMLKKFAVSVMKTLYHRKIFLFKNIFSASKWCINTALFKQPT